MRRAVSAFMLGVLARDGSRSQYLGHHIFMPPAFMLRGI